jgi:hypothetical protein
MQHGIERATHLGLSFTPAVVVEGTYLVIDTSAHNLGAVIQRAMRKKFKEAKANAWLMTNERPSELPQKWTRSLAHMTGRRWHQPRVWVCDGSKDPFQNTARAREEPRLWWMSVVCVPHPTRLEPASQRSEKSNIGEEGHAYLR